MEASAGHRLIDRPQLIAPHRTHREEQHDDQLLFELLRCIKALSTSSLGLDSLRSSSPSPFVALTALLYSDKKPGDVPSRQLIVELITLLFDLYPSLPATGLVRWPGDRPDWRRQPVWPLPTEWTSAPEMVRTLMIGEDKEKDVVEFVRAARRPQVFKNYLSEMSDVWSVSSPQSHDPAKLTGSPSSRDYFWMFCHANGVWRLDETDATQIERPTAPGGATGGGQSRLCSFSNGPLTVPVCS